MEITSTDEQSRAKDAASGRTAFAAIKAAGTANLREVVAARVDGALVDLSRPVREGSSVEPVSSDSAAGLDVIRHSTAHLMAQAVKRLFPDVQVTIGPTIQDGFYYDFKKDTPFSPEDLERIEAEMRVIVKSDFPVTPRGSGAR